MHKGDEVRMRKVGARLGPSNPSSLWSEPPSVASCCGAERKREPWCGTQGPVIYIEGRGHCESMPAYAYLLPLFGVRVCVAEFIEHKRFLRVRLLVCNLRQYIAFLLIRCIYQAEICTHMDAAEGRMTHLINNARYQWNQASHLVWCLAFDIWSKEKDFLASVSCSRELELLVT